VCSGNAHNPSWTGGSSILSEVGTLQLEFNTLSQYTGNPVYKEKVRFARSFFVLSLNCFEQNKTKKKSYRVFEAMEIVDKHSGLYSVYVSPDSGQFTRSE
jgi:hypothetical protein